jgi:hypothetical protein
MTIYIKIPRGIVNVGQEDLFTPELFAEDYLNTVGEHFVIDNILDFSGDNQLTGSSRITIEQAQELKSRWPMMQYFTKMPKNPDWVNI